MTLFGFHVFFFFLLHRLAPMAIFFSSSSSFFFLSFLLHRNSWVTLSKKKKKIIGTDFSNPKNQTHKHMIPIIYTNKQTQTHKHVHPHNKSKNFFSKYKQNPEVRNEREERGREEGWRSALFGPGEVGIGTIWTR